LPLAGAPEANKLIDQSHRWQKTAIAAAALALLGLSGSGAYALSLGRMTVQSALGEPLRAEVEVPDINAEEAASLKAGVAAPEAFVAAGLEYSPALSRLKATLQRRANGSAYLQLSSERTVNEPFIDIILEASWSSGRVVRDYTLLFDPPTLRKPTPTATLPLAATTEAPVASTSTPKSSTEPANDSGKSSSRSTGKKPASSKPAVVAPPNPTPAANEAGQQIIVKTGDTASKIANRVKPEGISLDQMLVAMLRSNPNAFIGDNINRMRSGAVLNVPTAEVAQSVSAAEATQIVVAQSKDFNGFRSNLASNAPDAGTDPAGQSTKGQVVDTRVNDQKKPTSSPDVLQITKGSKPDADAAKLAKELQEKENAARAKEIADNTKALQSIGAAASAAAGSNAPAATASQPKLGNEPSTPAIAVTSPTAPMPAASEPQAPATDAAATASAPAAPPTPPKVVPPAPVMPVQEEPNLMASLMEDPLLPIAGGAGLLAILGGLGVYFVRQRKKNAGHVDSSFLESRLQPDSFFGASGGQRVDTSNSGAASASSMVYSASQLDAADDVDPVAEADVYLAYGRDVQAEEILKEAVRMNPGRLAIHTKLLEIFAKRRDAKAFESTATQAFKIAGGGSPEWARVCEMGLGIDPTNPLYQPGGAPSNTADIPVSVPAALGANTIPVAPTATAPSNDNAESVDLDLDLDFSLDDEPASAISDVTGGTIPPQPRHEPTVRLNAQPTAQASASTDFELPEAPAAQSTAELPDISLSLDSGHAPLEMPEAPTPSFGTTSPAPVAAVAPQEALDSQAGMLEFDMDSLSLDLDSSTPAASASPAPEMTDDPLATKLALAEEFVSIGDEDGARALIEEVMAEATGDMRAKAERALANLS
jgi:pilus assembly protein FimV